MTSSGKGKKDKRPLSERVLDALEEKIKNADLTVFLEEGLYIAITIDVAALSGKVPLWEIEGDEVTGIRGNDTFLSSQRLILIGVIGFVRDLSLFEIDTSFGILPGGIKVTPFKWAFPLLRGWHDSLATILRPPGAIAGHGQRWWKPLHPLERVLMMLMLPGLLRIAVRSTRQLVQLIK